MLKKMRMSTHTKKATRGKSLVDEISKVLIHRSEFIYCDIPLGWRIY